MRLTVAYDGTHFCGWQRQPKQRTVQGTLEKALSDWHGQPIELRAASRTDSGVHAWGQVAAFNTNLPHPMEAWCFGLNRLLPRDVSIRKAEKCVPDYHPRFDAKHKTYRYLIYDHLIDHPCFRYQAWCLGARMRAGSFDVERVAGALSAFVGRKSFHAFCAANDDHESTVVEVLELSIQPFGQLPGLWAVEIKGTAFLRNMVRIIVGTLVGVGIGRYRVDDVRRMFEPEASRSHAGVTAPAHGLTLIDVALGRNA